MSCRVMRCQNRGTKAFVISAPEGVVRQDVLVCDEHHYRLTDGEEWTYRAERVGGVHRGDPLEAPRDTHMVMGADLLELDEWVVESFDGLHSSIGERSSDDASGHRWIATFTARQRGTESTRPLRLVMTQELWGSILGPRRE